MGTTLARLGMNLAATIPLVLGCLLGACAPRRAPAADIAPAHAPPPSPPPAAPATPEAAPAPVAAQPPPPPAPAAPTAVPVAAPPARGTRVSFRILAREAGESQWSSQVALVVVDARGNTRTLGPFRRPCVAQRDRDTGEFSCMFGASFETARVEVHGGQCVAVADYSGEHTGMRRGYFTYATFACEAPVEVTAEEAPGLAPAF